MERPGGFNRYGGIASIYRWARSRPITLTLEWISWQRDAAPRIWPIDARPVDLHPAHVKVGKAVVRFVPIVLAAPKRRQ